MDLVVAVACRYRVESTDWPAVSVNNSLPVRMIHVTLSTGKRFFVSFAWIS